MSESKQTSRQIQQGRYTGACSSPAYGPPRGSEPGTKPIIDGDGTLGGKEGKLGKELNLNGLGLYGKLHGINYLTRNNLRLMKKMRDKNINTYDGDICDWTREQAREQEGCNSYTNPRERSKIFNDINKCLDARQKFRRICINPEYRDDKHDKEIEVWKKWRISCRPQKKIKTKKEKEEEEKTKAIHRTEKARLAKEKREEEQQDRARIREEKELRDALRSEWPDGVDDEGRNKYEAFLKRQAETNAARGKKTRRRKEKRKTRKRNKKNKRKTHKRKTRKRKTRKR